MDLYPWGRVLTPRSPLREEYLFKEGINPPKSSSRAIRTTYVWNASASHSGTALPVTPIILTLISHLFGLLTFHPFTFPYLPPPNRLFSNTNIFHQIMATVPALAQSASRGSKHELSYASPLVIRMRGDLPDTESLERHNSKRQSEGFNDEDGKLGDDGRKRRSWGSSDDEGPLTHDNLHNEDLRVGGPYLCSIPTANVVVPKNHVKFRLTCLETDEGWELGQKILNIVPSQPTRCQCQVFFLWQAVYY